jgi:IS30 family transposase
MLDMLEALAVREAVERQTPIRRRICEMIMEDYKRWEIAEILGRAPQTISHHVRRIRESFCEMGFDEWLRPRRAAKRRRRRAPDDGRPKAVVNVSWRRV